MRFTKQEFEASDFELHALSVNLEAVTHEEWYDMRREQPGILPLSKADPRTCSFCCDDLTQLPAIKCTECEKTQVVICLSCFKLGAQAGEHIRGHNYAILNPVGPKVFGDEESELGEEQWGCYEDLNLLASFCRSHLDQWPDISEDSGQRRSISEALHRIDKYFIRSAIGEYVLDELHKNVLRLAIDESELSELPSTHDLKNGHAAYATIALSTEQDTKPSLSLRVMHEGRWRSQGSPPHSPISDKRLPLMHRSSRQYVLGHYGPDRPSTSRTVVMNGMPFGFEDEDEDDSDSTHSSNGDLTPTIMEQSTDKATRASLSIPMSPIGLSQEEGQVNGGSSNTYGEGHSARRASGSSKRENKNDASLPDTELQKTSNGGSSRTKSRHRSGQCQGDGATEERVRELRQRFPNSFFYDYKPDTAKGGCSQGSFPRIDTEDLQLLAYMPKRDEFEHEYKNDAEQLISNIVSVSELEDVAEASEQERIQNQVRLARIRRYNRVLKLRETKRNIIREHQLVPEYLNIVKNSLSEKGRYNVLEEVKYFNSKQGEDFFKPLFFQLRQVADKSTIEQLADNVGKMEALKAQIEELREMQKEGVKVFKGSWTRKRRQRKSESVEQRKAGLRWKRIKRWTKKQGLATDETDD